MQMDITLKTGIGGNSGHKPAAPMVKSNDAASVQPRQPAQAERSSAAADPQQLEAAVEQLAQAMQNVQRNLNFSIDESSGRTVVKVIDSSSDEIIRQFPSEEALALARRMKEMDSVELSGFLLQSKA